MGALYHTSQWRRARQAARQRDSDRCTVARLLGGACSNGPHHVHHIVPLADGGAPFDLENLATVCSAHHAMWEPLRRQVVARRPNATPAWRRCPHRHRTAEGRAICERRLNGITAVA